ncbi:MAG: epoxyqueuosine reductase [Treponema sp.]|nr:epoxyqueuosine reductase [Treponema sp.]
MNSKEIKQILNDLGTDICGIASIDRFTGAPQGFHPADTLPSCKSVIVFGKKFLEGTLECNNTVPYTIVRNMLSHVLDNIALEFCYIMQSKNIVAVPTGTIGPTLHDKKTGRFRNVVSAKHSAVLAGLGYIGKNTLLITPEYGNMAWLSSVLVNIELEPDKILDDKCPEDCSICIDNCPVNALTHDNPEMDQMKCFDHAFHTNEGEDFYFKCNTCRTICPKCRGNK